MDKTRHAFGSSSGLQSALDEKKINEFDVLFLDSDTDNPKFGWVSPTGKVVLFNSNGGSSSPTESVQEIIRVDELPTVDGNPDVIYIYNNDAYIWDSTSSQCVPLCEPTDLTNLTSQVTELETQMTNKVDADTVQTMIEEHVDAANEVIEF